MKKSWKLVAMLLLLSFSLSLAACGQSEPAATEPAAPAATTEEAVAAPEATAPYPMAYITAADVKKAVDAKSKDYILLDVRKAEDYNKAHIAGSYMSDVDAANKGGDDAAGTASLKKALLAATGSETGKTGVKYALVCYSGKSYAQKATDLMIQMGVSANQIVTLEGGMKAWEAGGDDYKALLK